MNNMDRDLYSEEYTIDISNLIRNMLKGLKKLFWLIPLSAAIVSLIICLYFRESYSPKYTAAVTFTVNLNMESNGTIYEDTIRASQMSSTFPYIITSSVLKNIIAEELKLDSLEDLITADNVEDTNLFTIKVTSDSPQRAYDVLQSVIRNYPLIAETVVGGTHLNMIEETGVPNEPSNLINYFRLALYGALIGAAVGLLLLAGYAVARKTIHKPDDLTEVTNIKFLGMLPHLPGRKGSKLITNIRDGAYKSGRAAMEYIEDLYKIRTRADKIINSKGMKVVLVTSAIPGEGKSTFAFNLALAMAEQERKILLLDCDFCKPSIYNMLSNTEGNISLNDVLEEKAILSDAIKYHENLKISVLACYRPIVNSSDIIGAQRMSYIIEQLKEDYDYIIIDSAPSAVISDTLELAKAADGVIYVIRQDYSKIRHIQKGLEHIVESSRAEIIGCVLNNARYLHMSYGYGYRYGYYGSGYYGKYAKSRSKKESRELITEQAK